MAKGKAANIDVSELALQTKESLARAELFEARARIATAQAEIAKGQLERKRLLVELDSLMAKKK